jgi:hypothetical protein
MVNEDYANLCCVTGYQIVKKRQNEPRDENNQAGIGEQYTAIEKMGGKSRMIEKYSS